MQKLESSGLRPGQFLKIKDSILSYWSGHVGSSRRTAFRGLLRLTLPWLEMETVQRGKGFRCCFPSFLRVLQRTVKLSSQLLRFHDHTQQEGASSRAPPLASLVTPAFISLPWTKLGLTVLTTGGKARGTPEGPKTASHQFSSLPLYLLAFLH